MSSSTIPAAAGTLLIWLDPDTKAITTNCVVGWRIDAEETVTPLILDAHWFPDGDWYIKHPDESVEANNGRRWQSMQAWRAEMRG